MNVTLVDGDLPEGLMGALLAESVLAVDTETSGLDWRDSQLHVCQVYGRSCGTVILRHAVNVPTRLATVLGDPRVTKVFHFAPFDLRFLISSWGVDVQSVACTRTASKLLKPAAPASSHSLGSLTARYLGAALDKGDVRTSDWGAETLSARQLAYAVGDVEFLPDLLERMLGDLDAAHLTRDFWSVCQYMPLDARLEVAGIPNPLTY